MPQTQQNKITLEEFLELVVNRMDYLIDEVHGLKSPLTNVDDTLSSTPSKIENVISELPPHLHRIFVQQQETNDKLEEILKGMEEQKKVEQERVRAEEHLADAVRELTSQMKINATLMEKSMLKPAQNSASQTSANTQAQNTTPQTPAEPQDQAATPQTPVEVKPVQKETKGISQKLAQQDTTVPKVSQKEREIADDILSMLALSYRTELPRGGFLLEPIDKQDNTIFQWKKAYLSYLKHTGHAKTTNDATKLFNSALFKVGENDFELNVIRRYNQDRQAHLKSEIVSEVLRRRKAIING